MQPDPLERLRDQIKATQEAAERLAEEAADVARAAAQGADEGTSRARSRRRPPIRGYAVPGATTREQRYHSEVQALAGIVDLVGDMLRGLVPRDLQQQLLELVRELLLLVRSLLDWYVARIDARRAAPVEIEDIPIT